MMLSRYLRLDDRIKGESRNNGDGTGTSEGHVSGIGKAFGKGNSLISENPGSKVNDDQKDIDKCTSGMNKDLVDSNADFENNGNHTLYPGKLKDLPAGIRPREMLIQYGVGSLTTPQLLAIILRSGSAKENVLSLAERLYLTYPLQDMARINVKDLSREAGIGSAKACQILSSLELGKRLLSYEQQPIFTRPSEAAHFLMPELSGLQQEHFKCLHLDRKNRLVSDRTLFIGTSGESLVDPATIMREALITNAAALILAHNHPSGDTTPSRNDVEITKRLCEAGRLLGIEVYDHIIIGKNSFSSLAEKGLILYYD